jgi:hypothetical protein
MMSMNKVSSGKRGELMGHKKDERFTSFMGIQVEKLAMARNMMTIEVERLRTEAGKPRVGAK